MTLSLDTACRQGDFEGLDIAKTGQGSKKSSKARKSCEPKTIRIHEVPPWGLLSLGLTPEEAAAETARHFGITDPAHTVGLLWRLRQVAAAEGFSATQPLTTLDLHGVGAFTHSCTHESNHVAGCRPTARNDLARAT